MPAPPGRVDDAVQTMAPTREPGPPEASQISTVSPGFSAGPCFESGCRWAVE